MVGIETRRHVERAAVVFLRGMWNLCHFYCILFQSFVREGPREGMWELTNPAIG